MRYTAVRDTHRVLNGDATVLYFVVDSQGSDGTTVAPTVIARARTWKAAGEIASAMNASPGTGV